jgi:hypothetical protein
MKTRTRRRGLRLGEKGEPVVPAHFPKADAAGMPPQLDIPQGTKAPFIELRGAFEIADAEREMTEHFTVSAA